MKMYDFENCEHVGFPDFATKDVVKKAVGRMVVQAAHFYDLWIQKLLEYYGKSFNKNGSHVAKEKSKESNKTLFLKKSLMITFV